MLAPIENDTMLWVCILSLPSFRLQHPPCIGELVNAHKSEYLDIAPREECRSVMHMESFFQDIIDKGGEGIILRDPLAPLQPGRSAGFLKHKVLPTSVIILIKVCDIHYDRNSETPRRR